MTISMTVDLADLDPDETINARRVRNDDGIAELKASIHAHGLVQPLRVRRGENGRYRIVAGSRRHRVLCELATAGESAAGVAVTPDFQVPVLIGEEDDTTARELSQAENFIRLPQHEADTYETFRELADRGLAEPQIAARFGIDPKRVRRMLALGRLSPMIIEAWRSGEFDEYGRGDPAQVVRAFTLAPSIKDQERVFNKLKKVQQLWSHTIQHAFGAGDRDVEKNMKIAGLAAYKAAGGGIIEDLFGDRHVIADKPLLQRLAEEKIERTLAGLKAEGWSWVSMSNDLPGSWNYTWSKEKPAEGKATSAEKKQIKKLEKEIAKDKAGAADEFAALQRAIAGRQWTPDQLARGGAVLEISYHGDVQITRGVVRPEPTKKGKAAGETKEKGPPTVSNAMMHRLSVQATAAAQKAIADEPRLGLVALLAGCLSNPHDLPVKVSLSGMGGGIPYGEREPFSKAFNRLVGMTDVELFRVAAGLAGRAIDMQSHNSARRPFDRAAATLAAAIDADRMTAALRETFDAKDYFAGVAKPLVVQAIREAMNEDQARKADKLKKAELVEFAVANVPGTGWLPPELRAATYSGAGAIPQPLAEPDPESDPDFDEIDGDEDQDEAA